MDEQEYPWTADDDSWWQQQDNEERRRAEEFNLKGQDMKVKAKESINFDIAPAGNHLAICYMIADLGLQPGSRAYPDPKDKLRIQFELPNEPITYEKNGEKVTGPKTIGMTVTRSMSERSNLRKHIQSWRGAKFTDAQASDFDLSKLLGQTCMVNVTHEESGDKTYANIQSITPVPKGFPTDGIKQHNDSLLFDLEAPDQKVFAKLPKWIREKIETRLSRDALEDDMPGPGDGHEDAGPSHGEPDDDLPF